MKRIDKATTVVTGQGAHDCSYGMATLNTALGE
ncbi:hypothetical protein N422_07205 [Lacticaseibacillus paracasei]|nr:hypothetical protein N422_07205 [Lacticaseibacillus paracasei]